MIAFVNSTSFQILDDEVFSYDSNGYINSPYTRGKKFDRIIPGDLRNFNEININGVRTFYNKKHIVNYNTNRAINYTNEDTIYTKKQNTKYDKSIVNKSPIIKSSHNYTFNYDYSHVDNKKLIYQIISKSDEIVIINDVKISTNKGDSLRIFLLENGKYDVLLNSKSIMGLNNILNIEYIKSGDLDSASICIPMSILSVYDSESVVNFDFIINKILKTKSNVDICISHTESEYSTFIDKFIMDNNINYIFVKNPYNFNLGYNRNLYKYISNSEKIIFTDIDIYLSDDVINDMLEKSKEFDIVKPYDKSIIYTTNLEKYIFMKSGNEPKASRDKIATITGGTTLFNRYVLEETGGYEEYNAYGYEDRALDVVILYKEYSFIKIDNNIMHLFHKKHPINKESKIVYKYQMENYGCVFENHKRDINSIHDSCNHKVDNLDRIIEFNKTYNTNLNLFKNPNLDSPTLK